MRINGMNKVSQLYKANSTKNTMKAKESSFSDKLEISKTGKDYQIAKQAVMQCPDVREEKIQEIKQRMESGNYNINAQEVAEKLVNRLFDESI